MAYDIIQLNRWRGSLDDGGVKYTEGNVSKNVFYLQLQFKFLMKHQTHTEPVKLREREPD